VTFNSPLSPARLAPAANNASPSAQVASSLAASRPAATATIDLLDMGGQNDLVAAVNSVSAQAPRPPLYLKPGGEFNLTPPAFQKMWTSLSDAFSGKLCGLTVPVTAPAQIEALFAAVQVQKLLSYRNVF
jgi:hypothetical protein